MPVTIQCRTLPLKPARVRRLWQAVRAARRGELRRTGRATRPFPDESVTIRCVTEKESVALNWHYRHRRGATNVLTFSYGQGEHDVALCIRVATREASGQAVAVGDYVGRLLVHAFLHATGMDHVSASAAAAMARAERAILLRAGFSVGGSAIVR